MLNLLVGAETRLFQKVGFLVLSRLVAALCIVPVIFTKSLQPDMYEYHDRRHRQW
jgi:hypothetical protein